MGRIERIGLVEAKYGVAQFVYSWPLVPDLALLPGLVKPATPQFRVLAGHPEHPPARYNLCRWTSGSLKSTMIRRQQMDQQYELDRMERRLDELERNQP